MTLNDNDLTYNEHEKDALRQVKGRKGGGLATKVHRDRTKYNRKDFKTNPQAYQQFNTHNPYES